MICLISDDEMWRKGTFMVYNIQFIHP